MMWGSAAAGLFLLCAAVAAAAAYFVITNRSVRPADPNLSATSIVSLKEGIAAFMLVVGTAAAWAQTTPQTSSSQLALPPLTVQAKPADPCVAVDAAGRKAGDAECAAQKLQDAAKAAQDRAGQGRDTANLPTASSHDTRIGVANQTATKQRLGSNFGKSVLPQRPNIAPPAPTPFTRQH